eukprot:GHRQ01038877.1.p3 GENE.GHRQ01038877.1~~GHRQ01038877.1.p3  ORF type:complete len:131 (-),score=49.69 GHRQ01038877.1:65-457(-)
MALPAQFLSPHAYRATHHTEAAHCRLPRLLPSADWGLFLCPAPDVSLASRVAGHTLFVLGRELGRRVGFKDCVVPPDTRIGVGFGDKTALSEWMGQSFVQVLGDGSKHVVVGTIVTDVPCKELAESAGMG